MGSLSWRFPQQRARDDIQHVSHTQTHCDCGDFRWCRGPDGTARAPRATGSHCVVAAETSLFMSDMFFCLFYFFCLMWARGNVSHLTPQCPPPSPIFPLLPQIHPNLLLLFTSSSSPFLLEIIVCEALYSDSPYLRRGVASCFLSDLRWGFSLSRDFFFLKNQTFHTA